MKTVLTALNSYLRRCEMHKMTDTADYQKAQEIFERLSEPGIDVTERLRRMGIACPQGRMEK